MVVCHPAIKSDWPFPHPCLAAKERIAQMVLAGFKGFCGMTLLSPRTTLIPKITDFASRICELCLSLI